MALDLCHSLGQFGTSSSPAAQAVGRKKEKDEPKPSSAADAREIGRQKRARQQGRKAMLSSYKCRGSVISFSVDLLTEIVYSTEYIKLEWNFLFM